MSKTSKPPKDLKKATLDSYKKEAIIAMTQEYGLALENFRGTIETITKTAKCEEDAAKALPLVVARLEVMSEIITRNPLDKIDFGKYLKKQAREKEEARDRIGDEAKEKKEVVKIEQIMGHE